MTGLICLIISRWAFVWRGAWRCGRDASPDGAAHATPFCVLCVAASKNDTCVSNLFFTPHEPERGEDWGNRGGVAKGCFWSHAGLVSMLADTLLLFREISVRPSPQFISSHNHKLSKLSYSQGSACRQVSVSTAAEPKYLSNPPSLFNYPHVLEKWCKPSCIYDTLPASPMIASKRGRLVWTVNRGPDEQEMESKWELLNGVWTIEVYRCGGGEGGSLSPRPRGVPPNVAWWKAVKMTRLERHTSGVYLLIWGHGYIVFLCVMWTYPCVDNSNNVLIRTEPQTLVKRGNTKCSVNSI